MSDYLDYEDDFDTLDLDPESDSSGDQFADPFGNSALRAVTKNNPRIFPCPTCHSPDRLTQKDIDRSYQCDRCADRDERGGY